MKSNLLHIRRRVIIEARTDRRRRVVIRYREITRAHPEKNPIRALAAELGLKPTTIYKILSGER